ncbi:unnamed protein product [Linum tenue]|uniref:EF-hand domain-containing protein n=1 Tax=Linum tenue TaxID=586396 RepID=A0AAV0I806_9ROSI|nr:unnamed protein product [Linum tenue]
MTPGLHAADLRRIFHRLDRNGDGLLSIDELGWLLDRIGPLQHFTSDELESSVGKSALDFDEFLAFCRSIEGGGGESAAAVERDLEEAFRVFDLNGDGLITSEELQKVLSRLGLWDETTGKDEKSGRDPAAMICKFDKNFDGLLDFDEFRTMQSQLFTFLHPFPTAVAAMKSTSPTAAVGTALVKTPYIVKFAAVALLSLSVALLFYHHPSFPSAAFSAFTSLSSPTAVAAKNSTSTALNSTSTAVNTSSTILKVKKLPPPPPSVARRTGIVDENGAMTEDFEIGEFDPSLMEELRNLRGGGEETEKKENEPKIVKYDKFKACDGSKIDHIPCLDKSERHCPDSALDCVVPMPNGYQKSLPWPRSRDEVWLHNVPDTRLVQDQGGQYSMLVKDAKISFQDGGSDQYVNLISQVVFLVQNMVPDIDFGHHTRVALDISPGIGSFAASLFRHNVTTLLIGTKDVHKNQIQFALERGLPAMVVGFGTRRLPYASQAFDLIRSSGSGIDWTVDNGVLLLEVNRLLRAGRYFVWGGPQVDNNGSEMEGLAASICWQLVKKEGNIAIWRKPLNSSCYLGREIGAQPPLCNSDEDPDNVWYVNVTACITLLPEVRNGGNVSVWPARLHSPPDRLQSIKMDAMISRKELMKAESRYWNEIIDSYVRAFHWKEQNFRNVLDMRAGFGGFAAAVNDLELTSWVMNVVPVNGFNTLPVIYDRGLLGVMHDWCEPFDTYPRSYDLIHAAGLFSDERKRGKCNFSTILLEMDRMLRHGGTVYIRDSLAVIGEIHEVASAMGWVVMVHDTGEGPHASWRFLVCEKRMP